MAEGFARRYGSDVMEPVSAGLAPANIVQLMTKQAMEARGIKIDDQYPKDLSEIEIDSLDLIINMSGRTLSKKLPMEVRNWEIVDPIGQSEEVYLTVRDKIEHWVMNLILELRRDSRPPQERTYSLRHRLQKKLASG